MRINIATKIFGGFLVIIILNISFVFIVNKLSSLNEIAKNLKVQNEVGKKLIEFRNLHYVHRNIRLIYNTIGKQANVEKFQTEGDQNALILHEVILILKGNYPFDSTSSPVDSNTSEMKDLLETVEQGILKYHTMYLKVFAELTSLPKKKLIIKNDSLNSHLNAIEDKIEYYFQIFTGKIDGQIGIGIKEIETRIESVNRLTQIILLMMTFFSILYALLFSRFISNHLRRLKESTSTIAKGEFIFNPQGYPNDEIGDLANAFFDMAYDLKKTQDELIKKRRLAAIGEIVASVNHEINNPLMIISGNAQFLEMTLEEAASEDTKERIHAILEETERISEVTRKLRDIKNPVVEDYTSSGEQMINLDKSSK